MKIEVKVPSPGESISEVQLAAWLVENGEHVEKDQEIAELDSDKASLNISAEEAGKIELKVEEGDTVDVDAVIAVINTEASGSRKEKKESGQDTKEKEKVAGKDTKETGRKEEKKDTGKEDQELQEETDAEKERKHQQEKPEEAPDFHVSPLARKMMQKHNVADKDLFEFFKNIRVSKADVAFFLENKNKLQTGAESSSPAHKSWGGTRDTESKKMSTLRLKLGKRLVAVKNETAMLTTFNEVNMTPIMEIRKKYKEAFKEKYGVGLGFMSFFTKAITEALNLFPQVNAQIDGNEIRYHHYADIGIAVSAPKGLMVPIIRNAETKSFAEIEQSIKDLAEKARKGKLSIEEMEGGTFTITNGGVFGSMLSTPILNPPQSAILGMHNIVERPIAVNGKVEIHPIMYVALSYDHRIIDGKESVSFLYKVKELLEDP
ncbi:MAG: 2-oxoglutarate dehydrogenase complex dihydrolipoyllysine-residue succinyltransferase, partial [Bacteroidales bacterium]|nr:2-oxoglutarate dehydrogenase complex dihydrolipoyllysine-residue succinyltransferase [Bacteroidales bacterium]